jgi:hypothetical protein
MAAPIVMEVAFWIWALTTGHALWLVGAIMAMLPIIHLNHWYNVQTAEHEARAYAVADQAKPVARIGLSLTPRRLRDFTNRWLEAGIWVGTVAAFGWLARLYAGGASPARQVFGLPVFFLYLQLGLLLAKRVIVNWRAPVPIPRTAEYLNARDAMRRYYLWTCDCNRIAFTLGIFMLAVSLSCPEPWRDVVFKGWGLVWAALCVGLAVWTEIKRKQVADIGVRARPVRMPDLSGMGERMSWPVCFEPEVPMLVLQGERGYSVNLANTAAYLALAYAVGMVALVMLARR